MARLAGDAYERLRHRILIGDLRDGDRLAEEDLAESLGISRTPVREALRRLAAEGLVELLPNRGARVPTWDDHDVDDIFELRAVLESHAARRAALQADENVLGELASMCEAMEAITVNMRDEHGLAELAMINRQWHGAVVAAAGSPRLSGLVNSLVHVPVIMQTFKNYSATALERSLLHHREIVDALAVRDAEWASSVMRAHILAARHQVLCLPLVDAALTATATDTSGAAAVDPADISQRPRRARTSSRT
jgi:DNA-binding GntR family transcriptional regulator